jgi:hypothetical protein
MVEMTTYAPSAGRMEHIFLRERCGRRHAGSSGQRRPGGSAANERDGSWQIDGRGIAGGHVIGASSPPDPPPNWQTFFAVADSDAASAKATEFGGSVVMPGMETPYGRIAILADRHGTVFATVQLPR